MRLILILFISFTFLLPAEESRKGTVKVDNLRMRTKPGTPSDVLGELDKGAPVKILEEKNGWLRIQAPDSLTAWTSRKFIENGEITGNNVRVRSGPNVANQVIGKLNKGDKVEILEIKKEVWAKIKVPDSMSVWISAAFVDMEDKEVVVKKDPDMLKKEAEELARKEAEEKEKVKALEEKLAAEKKAAEEARKKLKEQEKEMARLELEKNQAEIARQEQEKKVKVIKKLLEIEEKKRSKKLVVNITADDKLTIGSQETAFEDRVIFKSTCLTNSSASDSRASAWLASSV